MARNGDGDKSVQNPISMPDSYWCLLDYLIDQDEDTNMDRSKMFRKMFEAYLHSYLIENDPKNKKCKAFFTEAYKRLCTE